MEVSGKTDYVRADKKFLEAEKTLPETIEECPGGVVMPIDKPYRWTSADVIRKVKFAACRHFGKKNLKVGHAGTLDPLATGVLLVCIGSATKMAEELQRHDKEYVAGIAFGATTASYDREKPIDRLWPIGGVSEEKLREVLPSFLGEQEQVAPLFSAKSVDGRRAYELARKLYCKANKNGTSFDQGVSDLLSRQRIRISGLEVLDFRPASVSPIVIQPSNVNQYATSFPCGDPDEDVCGYPADAQALDWNALPPDGLAMPEWLCPELPHDESRNGRIHVRDNSSLGLPLATIRVACSKGTYIRAFARDLGETLGSGAHLDSLQRSASGTFRVEDALPLPDALSLLPAEG